MHDVTSADHNGGTAFRAAIYARFSSEMQSPRSIDDQVRECSEFAERQRWQLVRIERDAAVRAGATAGRVGFQRVMEAAARREFDVLLVDEVSRFSRDFFAGLGDVAVLRGHGIRLADRHLGVLDLDSQVGQIQLALGLSTSEHETKRLGERSKRGLRGKVLRGFSGGGQPPFGYRRVPIESETERDIDGRPKRVGVRWEIDHEHAPVITQIFDRFALGQSKHAIAAWLNEIGVPTRRANQLRAGRRNSGTWSAAAIKRILGNEIYNGERIWNRTSRTGSKHARSGKKKQQLNDPTTWQRVRDDSLAIVDPQLWVRVQARMSADAAKYAETHTAAVGRKFLLSGLIECAACGACFVIGVRKRGVDHYRCGFSTRGSAVCSNRVTIPREALEARVRVVLDAVAKDPARLRELVHDHNARIAATNEGQLGLVRTLEGEHAGVALERDRFVEAIASTSQTIDVLVQQLELREARLRELAAQIERARDLVQPFLLPRVAAVRDYVAGHASLFDGDLVRDRAFLEGALAGLFVYPDGAIVLRFREEGLFGPVAAYELHGDLAEVGDAALPAKRALQIELVERTKEWALPSDRFTVVEAGALVGITTRRRGPGSRRGPPDEGPRDLRRKSCDVPRGIRTLVTAVKGRCPGPLDDGDDENAGPCRD
jgi:site-specific DNA recombinase